MEVIRIKIGFIGPGKAGVNLARYFTHKGIELTGFYGRTIGNTTEAANITNSKVYTNLKDIINESEIIFITTPDDIISVIDKQLSNFNLKNKSTCHISGACSSAILNNAKKSGALIYSVHPIFAFSNKNINLKELENIYFSIEGDNLKKGFDKKYYETLELPIINLMKKVGNDFFVRDNEDGPSYHLANVMASNLVLSLLESGVSYFKEMGLNEDDAIKALMPLIKGNINNIEKNGFKNSLTGPAARGDSGTIKKHLSVIKEEHEEIYKNLSLNLLKIAMSNDPLNMDENKKKTQELLRGM